MPFSARSSLHICLIHRLRARKLLLTLRLQQLIITVADSNINHENFINVLYQFVIQITRTSERMTPQTFVNENANGNCFIAI